MMNKLWVRLSLGFSGMVLVAVFVVALAGILVGRSDRFRRPEVAGRLSAELASYYRRQQDWSGVEVLLQGAQTTLDRRRPGLDVTFFLADAEQQVVYHPQAEQIGEPLRQVEHIGKMPIRLGHQTVGYLGLAPPARTPTDRPPDFFEFLGRTLLATAAVAGLGGIVFGILMSRSLTAPLNKLAEAARAIGARNLSQRVEERGTDEMVAVARAFNEMATDLEQAEQLRRNLLADVAHELRTPLSVVQGNLRAILDEVYPLDTSEIARLYEQTRLLSRLVNDLHELAQAEAKQLPLDLQETDPAQLISMTSDTFRPAAEAKGVTLQTELPSALPPIHVDAARLRQVLQNLLANALRHTPAGGTITIQAAAEPEAVCFSIADSGEGIPPEHLPHIFDRFYRADPARSRDRGGAGLGLAIARAIVAAHEGKISVASDGVSGKGSTFTIWLPLNNGS